jgi:starch phosphorylase
MSNHRMVAYFSMEVGIDPRMPTYAGGLGILAADTIRSAADEGVPMVAVTLLHRKGYFRQRLTPDGRQIEEPELWDVEQQLHLLDPTVSVSIEGRTVALRVWEYQVTGIGGFVVPVYFLDADVADNSANDRTLTDALYGGDERYRLCQEVILGIGGVRVLRALGHDRLERFHMNEGHASLLALELLDEETRKHGRADILNDDVENVRQKCVVTTHTPVEAGHDQFPMLLVESVLDRGEIHEMKEVFCCEGRLNMTFLGFNLSHYINGVGKTHRDVSQRLFAKYKIDAITNGVHLATWVAPAFAELYDRHVPDWRADNYGLRYVISVPREEVWQAHAAAKASLVERLNNDFAAGLRVDAFTIGFARRATGYKRADLLFANLERLLAIAGDSGRLQIVFGGKAHPRDLDGKEMIQQVFHARGRLRGRITVTYVENYDLAIAKTLIAGVDVWLNTPMPPFEASGTSGMKAAANGVPSLSVLDGWWREGHIEGVTGWAIGKRDGVNGPESRSYDATSLYDKLGDVILPMYFGNRDAYVDVMTRAIAFNASFFNTQRMVQQYVLKAYFE